MSAAMPRIWVHLLSMMNPENPAGNIQFSEHDDIQHSQQGDSEAFRRLVEQHQAHVSKMLWRFTRDTNSHEELVQETFVQAYMSLHSYQAQAPFEHWLARIATRVGYRFWKQREKHQHPPIMDGDWEHLESANEDASSPKEAAELLYVMMSKLPSRDRLVLTLRYLEQCDLAETARRMGWTITMVKVQTHRAKQKLKTLFEKADIELEL